MSCTPKINKVENVILKERYHNMIKVYSSSKYTIYIIHNIPVLPMGIYISIPNCFLVPTGLQQSQIILKLLSYNVSFIKRIQIEQNIIYAHTIFINQRTYWIRGFKISNTFILNETENRRSPNETGIYVCTWQVTD